MILLLVALSLAPLVYAVKGANVATVVVNGKVVVRNRRMETVDEGEVLAKARELSGRILQSLERR
jgi:5-methylthioadenosine/S-adenosylhomocysteine deaminase